MCKRLAFIFLILVLLTSCSTSLHSIKEQEMTLGLVQKEIHVGMSQAEVMTALGSPNIITKDKEGNQAWIYDKIATEVSQKQSGGGIWLLIGSYGSFSGRSASSQKTLTVVIKFDSKDFVDKVSYHASKF